MLNELNYQELLGAKPIARTELNCTDMLSSNEFLARSA